jgi:hypothetical protein
MEGHFTQIPPVAGVNECNRDFTPNMVGVNMSATMKPIGWAVLVLLIIVLWFSLRTRQSGNSSKTFQSSGSERSGASAYLGLRNLALQNPPATIQGASIAKPGEALAVLMDWGIPAGTATVAAYADGTASIYLSSGGGYLGGGQSHESIRNAAMRTVEIASELKSLMRPTTTYPLPQSGQVTFYVRTDVGVLTATAPEDNLRSHRSPLYKLGDSAQTIVTEYRLMQQSK